MMILNRLMLMKHETPMIEKSVMFVKNYNQLIFFRKIKTEKIIERLEDHLATIAEKS